MQHTQKFPAAWPAVILAVFLVSAGCTQKPAAQDGAATPSPAPEAQRAPQAVPPEQTEPQPEGEAVPPSVAPVTPPAPTGTAGTGPQKPAARPATPVGQKLVPKDVVLLTGNPAGGVRFEHKKHAALAANKCETCHHASKPQKPATAPQQKCSTCHAKAAVPPMKTKYQAAFHNPTAKAGTCITCHAAQAAKGKKAPLKCAECHKKENK